MYKCLKIKTWMTPLQPNLCNKVGNFQTSTIWTFWHNELKQPRQVIEHFWPQILSSHFSPSVSLSRCICVLSINSCWLDSVVEIQYFLVMSWKMLESLALFKPVSTMVRHVHPASLMMLTVRPFSHSRWVLLQFRTRSCFRAGHHWGRLWMWIMIGWKWNCEPKMCDKGTWWNLPLKYIFFLKHNRRNTQTTTQISCSGLSLICLPKIWCLCPFLPGNFSVRRWVKNWHFQAANQTPRKPQLFSSWILKATLCSYFLACFCCSRAPVSN